MKDKLTAGRFVALLVVLSLLHPTSAFARLDTPQETVAKRVKLTRNTLSWETIWIGMSLRQFQKSSKKTLDLAEVHYADQPTGTFGAKTTLRHQKVSLIFSAKTPEAKLLRIRIDITPDCEHSGFRRLKDIIEERVGGLKPIEQNACFLKYEIPGPENTTKWIILKGDGLWLGYASQFE